MSVIINEKKPTELKTSDFYYDLPQELIAQHPAEKRDNSSLMVIHRETGEIEHKKFFNIIDYLNPGDVLVVNNSKVIPARLYGHSEGRDDAKIELLLLKSCGLDTWETLVKPGKRAKIGSRLVFGDGILRGEIVDIVEEGNRLIRFEYDREKYENDRHTPFYGSDGSEPDTPCCSVPDYRPRADQIENFIKVLGE